MQRSLVFLSFLTLAAASGFAQDPANAASSKNATLEAAHQQMTQVREKLNPELRELSEAMRAAKPEERDGLSAKARSLRSQISEAETAFEKAFAAADWQRLDPTATAEILKDGLPSVAGDTHDAQKAVAASQLYLKHFADGPAASQIRASSLPYALLAQGKADEAIDGLTQAAAAADGSSKARLLLTTGDIHASQGEVEEALAAYRSAGEASKDMARYVELRLELTGKPAPEIDSSTWIGGEAAPLSSLKGKVVLVDFWATWCGPCRAVMPDLNRLYQERQKDGLLVMGVTRFYENGYLPADTTEMLTGGESVKGLTEETFPAHVTTFKTNTGITYPFVIGAKEHFDAYKVSGIPTLAVVGPDGKIALVTVGSGSEPLIAAAVERLLKS